MAPRPTDGRPRLSHSGQHHPWVLGWWPRLARLFAPTLFVSYSRRDSALAASLVESLRRRGFGVFLDTSDIDPGDNFVRRLSGELRRATAVVALVSEHYLGSRWAQAELYYSVVLRKLTIPIVVPPASLAGLDQPLARLLGDTQFVAWQAAVDVDSQSGLADLLRRARRRRRTELVKRSLPVAAIGLLLAIAAPWTVGQLNQLDRARVREGVMREILDAQKVLQRERMRALQEQVRGDRNALGELLYAARDPARSHVGRFNALVLASSLLAGHREPRWYVKDLDLDRTAVTGVSITDATFLGGHWSGARFEDSTFSGVFWPSRDRFDMSGTTFRNVSFYGGGLEAINAVEVTFVNSKFRGTEVDTTNFAKVRFMTERPEGEGNPTITPYFALFERSVVRSGRRPPDPKVMDLSQPADDVIFDGVVFVDCRLEGWFKVEWFRNSSFERCDLPPSLTKEALERAGNTVY